MKGNSTVNHFGGTFLYLNEKPAYMERQSVNLIWFHVRFHQVSLLAKINVMPFPISNRNLLMGGAFFAATIQNNTVQRCL